jgi:CBS domain-containing protein
MADLRSLDVPDTYQIASDSDLSQQLGEVRLSRALTISATATVGEAIAVLRSDQTGAVVVVDGDTIVGIFTDRDVLKRVAGKQGALDEPVSRYMTRDPVLVRDTDTMATALNKMGDGGFRHIPMLSQGKLAAVVTGRDIMQWLLGRYFDQSSA